MDTMTLPAKLNSETKNFIMQAVYGVLSDPDFGLELQPDFEKKLQKITHSKKQEKLKTLKEVFA